MRVALRTRTCEPGNLKQLLWCGDQPLHRKCQEDPPKNILLMKPMQELLERQIPKWSTTPWGMSFQKALLAEDSYAIFKFWNTHVDQRPLVGQLVQCVSDVLDGTGRTNVGFRAAFVHLNRELGVDLNIENNEWAELLRNSYLIATYAVVNEVCLECRQPNHTTSICGDETRYTVLQTYIRIEKRSGSSSNSLVDYPKRLKIEPHRQTYKTVNDETTALGVAYFFTPESSIKRTFVNFKLTIAKERLDQSPSSLLQSSWEDLAARVTLRPSRRSLGGMAYKRDRKLLEDADCDGNGTVNEK